MHKALCVAISAALIALVLCSCSGGETQPSQSTAAAGETTSVSQPATVPETGSTAPATTADATTAEESTSAVTSSAPAPTTGLPEDTTPATTAEIVACFNEAANKVKREKSGYHLDAVSSTDRDQISIDADIPFKSFITFFIANGINKDSSAEVGKGESHADFPVKGQTLSSKLDAGALIGATCVKKGAQYQIEMRFREEKLGALPEKPFGCRHGKAFSLILASDFREAFGGIDMKMLGMHIVVENKKFAPTYHDSTIRCTIDAASLEMRQAEYILNTLCELETDINANNKLYPMNITFEYMTKETYIFS